jgi:hypothetical protein
MRRVASLLVAALVGVGLAFHPPMPAEAAVCQSGGDYDIDCTWPDSTSCNGANSTPRSEWGPGLGLLELRYDSGCRSIWGRAPNAASTDLYAQRTSCLSGNTAGLTVQDNGSVVWSRQLNDKNCTGQAVVFWQGNGYFTGSY